MLIYWFHYTSISSQTCQRHRNVNINVTVPFILVSQDRSCQRHRTVHISVTGPFMSTSQDRSCQRHCTVHISVTGPFMSTSLYPHVNVTEPLMSVSLDRSSQCHRNVHVIVDDDDTSRRQLELVKHMTCDGIICLSTICQPLITRRNIGIFKAQ
jgi:acyl-CoA thioesterase